MSLKNECSLKDCTKLRNLILENPDLPLLTFVGEEAWSGEYNYSQPDCTNGEIKELTLYDDTWMDKDDYEEKLQDDLSDKEEYKKLSNEDWNKMIADKITNTEFIKAIVVYIG